MALSIDSRFRGCLLGGAVGDALGAPVEFMQYPAIVSRFGPGGIRDYAPAFGKLGAITDDTQMTLFTAEGLLQGMKEVPVMGAAALTLRVGQAYQRWLLTQGMTGRCDDIGALDGLYANPQLHSRRAPGNTCLSALAEQTEPGLQAQNTSKGCGGVMRMAPVGLLAWHGRNDSATPAWAFHLGADLSGLTHGHPTGKWTAGILALLVYRLLEDVPLRLALVEAKTLLRTVLGYEETLLALEGAERLADEGGVPSETTVSQLGEGWVAEEALAIGVYCALVATTFEEGIILAVNHSGDTDSTGSIAGNLLGAMKGEGSIPDRWLHPLELRGEIAELADRLAQVD